MVSRFQVLEIASTAAGAHAGRLLAESGIPVLRIELEDTPALQTLPPFDKDGISVAYRSANSKKSLLRLRDRDSELISTLIARSSAFITDRPDWHGHRSRGTTCHILPTEGVLDGAFELPSSDVLVQAASGGASVTGRLTGPPVTIGFPIGDIAPGYFAAMGVLHGILNDEQQLISIRALDAVVSLLSYMGCCFVVSGEDVGFIGSGHPYIVPYGAFPASDGYVIVGAFTQSFWRKLCDMLGRADWVADSRFKTFVTRRDNRDELNRQLNDVFREQPIAHWISRLKENDVPHAPVLSLHQAVTQPTMAARDMIGRLSGFPVLNSPIVSLSDDEKSGTRSDAEVDVGRCLQNLGIEKDEIEELLQFA